MNRDPFLRLALVAAATLYVTGLLVVAAILGWIAGLLALVGGVAAAAALTVVLERDPDPEDPRRRQRQPADGTRGFDRIR